MKKLTCILACVLLLLCGCGAKQESAPALDPETAYYADIVIADYGTVTVLLDQKAAPITAANFVALAQSGFYEGTTFHRIINGFMMQGGAPRDGQASAECITGEFQENGYSNPLEHTRGVISMARSQHPDSASSQFFIMHQDRTHLDGKYAAFGHVVSGIEVVDAVCQSAQPIDGNGGIAPAAQPVITSVTIRTQ